MKPFSTYPEDRANLMALARTVQESADVEEAEKAADKLSDMVLAILSDEHLEASPWSNWRADMITASHIRNILGAMNSIDFGDVDKAILPYEAWHHFSTAPMRVFPKLTDAQQEAVAAEVNRRAGPHDVPAGIDDHDKPRYTTRRLRHEVDRADEAATR